MMHHPFGGGGPMQGFRGPPGPGYAFEKPFPVVRLRGLPFNANEIDIFEFFQGLDPVDVLMVRRDSRNTGEAYVLFGTAMQMDFALQKNRQSMGRRYIEVFRAKKQDYYNAVAGFVADPPPSAYAGDMDEPHLGRGSMPPSPHMLHRGGPPMGGSGGPGGGGGPGGHGGMMGGGGPGGGGDMARGEAAVHTGVLKMRGLPFSATKDDIITFFDDPSFDIAPLVHDSIHIVTGADGGMMPQSSRPSGVAFVEFASAEDAKTAIRKDRHTMGNRYVELFPSSREEATRAATAAR